MHNPSNKQHQTRISQILLNKPVSSIAIRRPFLCGCSTLFFAISTPTKNVNELLKPSFMLESNCSEWMAAMDVQLLLLYLSPIFLAFVGWEMLYLRKHGAAFPTATYQWRDLFANAALALMHQGGDALAAIAIAYLYDTLWGWRLFDIELTFWSVLLLFLLQISATGCSTSPATMCAGCGPPMWCITARSGSISPPPFARA